MQDTFTVFLMRFGCQYHDHPAALKFGVAFGFAHFVEISANLIENSPTKVHMGHFTTTEHKVELNLVTIFQEFAGLVHGRVTIVGINFNAANTQFLELRNMRSSVRLLFFFPLLIFPLAVVHHPTDRRLIHGGNLNEIQSRLPRKAQSLKQRDNSHLVVIFANQANRRDANLLVATQTVMANSQCS